MLAYCSNTTVYVGVTIFSLCGPVGVQFGIERCFSDKPSLFIRHMGVPYASRFLSV